MKNLILALLCLILLPECSTDKSAREQAQEKGKTSYKDTVEIGHAKGFSIEYYNNYKVVTLQKAGQESGGDRYVLVEKGVAVPDGYAGAQIIRIPVKSLVVTSSMHIGLLAFLEAENVLTGLGDLQYVYSPSVISLIESGKIAGVGKDNGLNEEKLIEMHPDVVMTVGAPGAKSDQYAVLRQAGIPVLPNSEWIETTPLARAEWVKLAAALLNKEKLVNEKFGKLEAEYKRLSGLAQQATTKPKVISGLNTKDVWFLPGGENFMARFLRDAGADYHWSNTKGAGSLSLNFEAVYPVALEADCWINVGFDQKDSRESILAADSRYADFRAAKTGNMFSYNNRVNARGSNDFFESGTVNPHIVLADLIHIFHPAILPDHQLVYYKKLP